jgi:hypothetical protein
MFNILANFKISRTMKRQTITFIIGFNTLLILGQYQVYSCTIVSAIARNGNVWNLNNEDGPFGVANFINVFPKSENAPDLSAVNFSKI